MLLRNLIGRELAQVISLSMQAGVCSYYALCVTQGQVLNDTCNACGWKGLLPGAGAVCEPLGVHVVDHDAAYWIPSMSDEVTLYRGWMNHMPRQGYFLPRCSSPLSEIIQNPERAVGLIQLHVHIRCLRACGIYALKSNIGHYLHWFRAQV